MLIPAKLMEAELRAAWRETVLRDMDRLRYLRLGTAAAWDRPGTDSEGDWHKIARASVSDDGEVLGYCSASIDRDCLTCTQLVAWSVRPSIAYLRDLQDFLEDVRHQVHVVRFTVAVGNPARKGWARWVQRTGGRQLCVLERYGKLEGGIVVDAAMYQVPGLLG